MDFIIGHWNNVFDKIHHRDYHDEYIWQECLKAIKENTNDNVVDLGRFICSLMMHLREHEDVFHRMNSFGNTSFRNRRRYFVLGKRIPTF